MHWICDSSTKECRIVWEYTRADNANNPNAGNFVWISNYSPPRTVDFKGMDNINV